MGSLHFRVTTITYRRMPRGGAISGPPWLLDGRQPRPQARWEGAGDEAS